MDISDLVQPLDPGWTERGGLCLWDGHSLFRTEGLSFIAGMVQAAREILSEAWLISRSIPSKTSE